MLTPWSLLYGNEWPDDLGHAEWWTVVSGERRFRCYKREDALWLAHVLNEYGEQKGDGTALGTGTDSGTDHEVSK